MNPDHVVKMALIVGVSVIMLIFYLLERKRSAALSLVAKDLGFEFTKSGRAITKSLITNFQLYKCGYKKRFRNEMWGREGKSEVSIFGYYFTVGSGKSSYTYKQTVIAISNHELNAPAFELRPENIFHKFGQALGFHDINFAKYPKFSSKFLLRGPNEQAIRDYFSPELIEFFENKPKIFVEAQGNSMIFYILSKRSKPEEIQSLYYDAKDIYYRLAAASVT